MRLALERMGPHLRQVAERERRHQKIRDRDSRPLHQALSSVAYEMAEVIFTPERRRRLAVDLGEYRRTLEQAGEQELAEHLQYILLGLALEEDPAHNRLLLDICYRALHPAVVARMKSAAAEGKVGG